MTRIHLELPSSIHSRAKELAQRDGVSLDQLVALALAEKMSALDTVAYLQMRAARGDREKFDHGLAKVPARKPLKGDKFPSPKK
jgi:hypothetical protein